MTFSRRGRLSSCGCSYPGRTVVVPCFLMVLLLFGQVSQLVGESESQQLLNLRTSFLSGFASDALLNLACCKTLRCIKCASREHCCSAVCLASCTMASHEA
jgi:hypothetical protein